MSKKIVWLDCETTGLDPNRNGIITLAGMMEIDGFVVDRKTFTMYPLGREVEPSALEVNGFTIKDVEGFKNWKMVKDDLCSWLGQYIDKFDKNDKATAAGYNIITFDMGFIESWFRECGDNYLYSWFDRFPLDVYRMVPMLEWAGLKGLPNRKLGTVCDAMGVKLEAAHEAMADVEATRDLAGKIRSILQGGLPE